jgi:hypothetical protein
MSTLTDLAAALENARDTLQSAPNEVKTAANRVYAFANADLATNPTPTSSDGPPSSDGL